MKLNIKVLFLFLTCIFKISTIKINDPNQKGPKTNPDPPANPSDAVYKRILDYINSLAEKKMKTSDIMAKKKISGALPEGFPEETIQKALETRNDKKKWRQILGIPTEVYRMCLYPFSKVNYAKWCNNNFFGAKNKGESKLFIP